MPDYPDIPPGFAIPLVDTATDLFDAATMDALDDRYIEEDSFFNLVRTAAYNFTATPGTPIAWSTVIEESSEDPAALAGFSTADWITFTCTQEGLYIVDVVITASNVAGAVVCDLYKNGAIRRTALSTSTTTTSTTVHAGFISRFEVGDTFKVHARASGTIAATVLAGTNVLAVAKVNR